MPADIAASVYTAGRGVCHSCECFYSGRHSCCGQLGRRAQWVTFTSHPQRLPVLDAGGRKNLTPVDRFKFVGLQTFLICK